MNKKPSYEELEKRVRELESAAFERQKAELRYLESEKRYLTLFENASDGIFLTANERILDCSQKALELFECTREEIIGHTPIEFSPSVQPDGRKSAEKAIEKIRAALDGYPQIFEWKHKKKSGALFDAEVCLNKVQLAIGDHILATIRDITPRKQAQHRQTFHKDLAIALNKATTLVETLKVILSFLIEVIEFEGGGIYLFDEKTDNVDLIVHQGLPPHFVDKVKHYDGNSPNAKLIKEGRIIYWPIADFPLFMKKIFEEIGLKFLMTIPIKYKNKIIAAINLSSASHDEISDSSVKLLESFSQIEAGEYIHRVMVEEALRVNDQEIENIFNLSMDMIGAGKLQGFFTRLNASFLKILGYSQEELLGNPFLHFVHPEDVDKTRKALESAQFGLEYIHITNRYQCKNGQYKWIEWNVCAIALENKFIAVGRDISERRQAEEALRQSESRFRDFYENAPNAYFSVGLDKRIIKCNRKAEELLGYSKMQIVGQNISDLYADTPLGKEKAQAVFNRFFDDETAIDDELQMQKADGSFLWVSLRVNAERDAQNHVAGCRAVVMDITVRKQLEAQLRQSHKMEAIGTLAGGIAHDFNNLLMGIQGRTSLLSTSLNHSDQNIEHVTAIDDYIQSATNLTQQLLGFARGGKYEVMPTDINELIENSIAFFIRYKKEIHYELQLVTPSPTAVVDRRQIEQVLINLYLNAWQAMPQGGKLHLKTTIVTVNDALCQSHKIKPGKYIKISVIDSGIGMDETISQRVFDPFFTTKEKDRGTGLGLASAYGIIKNHDGFITVLSKVGIGSTFDVYLPLSSKAAQKEVPVKEQLIRGNETVLLLDDEEIVTEVGEALLTELGYHVLIAKRGDHAIEMIEKKGNEIDLLILDMIMPGMDGSKVFDAVRKINPNMPVLLSSGYSFNDQASDLMQRGCDGFIKKPFTIGQLSQKVREILDSIR